MLIGFTLFQADSLSQAGAHILGLVCFAPLSQTEWSYLMELLSPITLSGLAIGLFVGLDGGAWMWRYLAKTRWIRAGSYALAALGFGCCYATLVASGYHPFIYFQF